MLPGDKYRLNAKSLLLYDDDHSTPADHYFAFINKHQQRDKQEVEEL